MTPVARASLLFVLLALGLVFLWRRMAVKQLEAPRAPALQSTGHASTYTTPAGSRSLAPPPVSGETWRGPQRREGVDAANLYAAACGLFAQLTDEEKKMLRKPGEEVEAEAAARLFEKIQAILALLREAAWADYCDWGTGDITFETSLPHIGKAQELGALALWAAAYRFPTDPAAALDDLSVRARLGHHLTDTLLGALVAASFEGGATQLVRDRLGGLDATTLGRAAEFIAGSTLDADLTRAMQGEISGIESMGQKLLSLSPEERVAYLVKVGGDAGAAERRAEAEQKYGTVLRDADRIREEVAFIRGIEEKMADAMSLPEAEFQQWWRGVKEELQRDHPLASAALPALDRVQQQVQQLRVERTLLSAGADILQHGPAQVGRYRDPATGAPLQYVETATGFELRAPYRVNGQPVSMTFTR